MYNITLTDNKAFPWRHEGDIHYKGNLYDESGNLLDISALKQRLDALEGLEAFKTFFAQVDGQFSILLERGDDCYAFTDFLRSFPLFIQSMKGENGSIDLHIADIPENLNPTTLDPIALDEMRLIGYALGKRTQYTGIKTLQAGQLLAYHGADGTWDQHTYRVYANTDNPLIDPDAFCDQLDNAYRAALQRVIDYAGDRTLVLPLSGGEDSRIVITQLHNLGFKNVICYSYGLSDSKEAKISKAVADFYGYPWLFNEYDDEKWRAFFESEDYPAFGAYHSKGVSIPHIQDYIAVKNMADKQLIPKDAIIVPGHTGDFSQGKHVPHIFLKEGNFAEQVAIEEIVNEHFNLMPLSDLSDEGLKAIYTDLYSTYLKKTVNTAKDANYFHEFYNWRERHAKFIVNAVKTYLWFDYEYRIPLLDKNVVELWNTVPLAYKYDRRLHRYYTWKKQKPLRGALGLPTEGELQSGKSITIKDILRYRFPTLFTRLKHEKFRRDFKKTWEGGDLGWEQILPPDKLQEILPTMANINSAVSYEWIEHLLSGQYPLAR